MQNLSYKEAADFLKTVEDAWILIHQSPDGDAVGTGFALRYLLEAMGKRARVVCPDEIPHRYDHITAPDVEFPAKTILSVDLADLSLLGALREAFEGKIALCIDHHVSNVNYADRLCLDADASAASEVLYEIIRETGVPMTEQMAACIYTGIATDTGCFKFENATPRCHEIVAALKREFALPYAKYNRELFDIKSRSRIQLERRAIDLMEYHLDGRCTVISITKALQKELNVVSDDFEGITALTLQTDGVEVGITIKEKEDGLYKLSLRSAGDANVSRICQTLGGGGHAKAAGCAIRSASLDEVKQSVVAAVAKELDAPRPESE
ncbi:MAG: DHH family phosphoesterase [Ruminococcus sp.]|nr:DHH family phosphoesterase [Ruminococcus sp.]